MNFSEKYDVYEKIDVTHEIVHDIILFYCEKYNLININVKDFSTLISKSLEQQNLSVLSVRSYISDYAARYSNHHPDYKKLSSTMQIDNLHCETEENFANIVEKLRNNVDKAGFSAPIVSEELSDFSKKYGQEIQDKLDFSRDYYLDYFSIKTLKKSYLIKLRNLIIDGKIVTIQKCAERPQHMFMRVSIGIHANSHDDDVVLEKVFKTYDLMSCLMMTHATPTLFNSGTPRSQMSSCFLFNMEDSMDEILDTIKEMGKISKWSGGVGVTLTDIRSKGAPIRGTNGISHGIIPLCQLINSLMKYVDQGGQKRMGACATYLEPWHADIFEFCELRKNTGTEDDKARDLFLGLWVNDLFMERVEKKEMWSLMCPDECPNLTTTHGEEFRKLYLQYEKEGRYIRQVSANDLMTHIMTSQIETGMPYMLYKDHANRKSNQQNLGTIKLSNLCTEIIEHVDKESTAVCNLASICLPKLVETCGDKKVFNFEKLLNVVETTVENLNIVIDKNFYPTQKTKNSNSKHRPIGLGVQGLADVYNIMGYPFDSKESSLLNEQIFETIYYGSVKASCELAKIKGHYESFIGSPASKGLLQYHLWGLTESDLKMNYDWLSLIEDVKKYGLRNSLLTTCMPTATTSQIMGNNESIEPMMSNIYTRNTLAGDFIVINEHLINDLIKLNLWSDEIRKKIIIAQGSIQFIKEIPKNIKNVYKTAFENKMKPVIDQSIKRGPFICQSQSLNLFLTETSFDKLYSAHMYGWKNGLKTGMYYLRSRAVAVETNFGIDIVDINRIKNELAEEESKGGENSNESGICKRRPGIKIQDCIACT
jgi:ribonucleoside-diphosphate reductase alpha chain